MYWFKTLSEKVTCTVSECCVFVSFYSPPLHAPFTVLFFSLATLIPPKAIFHLDSFRAGHRERSCAGGDGRNAFSPGDLLCSREILRISVSTPDLSLPNQIATCHPRGAHCFGLILATALFNLEMHHKIRHFMLSL